MKILSKVYTFDEIFEKSVMVDELNIRRFVRNGNNT